MLPKLKGSEVMGFTVKNAQHGKLYEAKCMVL